LAAASASRDAQHELCTRLKIEQMRLNEQLTDTMKRETAAIQKSHDAETALERAEQEHASTLADLRLALRRVDALSQV
jgi:hypothetical protein